MALDAPARPRRPVRWPFLERRGNAGNQAAAADSDDDHVDIGQVLEDLEPDRAVAGDHLRVVERVDEREAALVADPLHLGKRFADVRAVQDDLRAIVEAGFDF